MSSDLSKSNVKNCIKIFNRKGGQPVISNVAFYLNNEEIKYMPPLEG
jgi:hypothetical protein